MEQVVDRGHPAFERVFDSIEADCAVLVRQQGIAFPAERLVAKGLLLLQVAAQVGRGLPPQRDGGFELPAALGCALHQVPQAGVFEVDEIVLRVRFGAFADAAGGVDAGELIRAQGCPEEMAAELKAFVR